MWTALPGLAKGLIILAVCALVYWAVGHTYNSIKSAGYDQAKAEDAKIIKSKDDALAEKDRQIAAANLAAHQAKETHDAKVRDAEQEAARKQAEIEGQAAKEIANAKARSDKLVDDLLAGRVRLRVPGDAIADAAAHGDGQLPGAPAGADGRDGSGACELPGGTAANLARLAARADTVARKLNEARAIVLNDRALCSGAPPK